jgi:hypothetical protein
MHTFFVALVAAAAWSDVGVIEPSEDAMRDAFASDLRQGVRQVLSYVEQTGGDEAVRRIREARTDAYELRGFRKGECRPSEGKPGYICEFAVEVDTVAGPIEKSIAGRFYIGPCGFMYDHDA